MPLTSVNHENAARCAIYSQVPDGVTHVVSDKHGATPVDDDAPRLPLACRSLQNLSKRLRFPLLRQTSPLAAPSTHLEIRFRIRAA